MSTVTIIFLLFRSHLMVFLIIINLTLIYLLLMIKFFYTGFVHESVVCLRCLLWYCISELRYTFSRDAECVEMWTLRPPQQFVLFPKSRVTQLLCMVLASKSSLPWRRKPNTGSAIKAGHISNCHTVFKYPVLVKKNI